MNFGNIAVQLIGGLEDASLRAVALAFPVAVAAWIWRRRPAVQHALWTVLLAGMLMLPVLRLWAPPARVKVGSAGSELSVPFRLADAVLPPPSIRYPDKMRQPGLSGRFQSWQFYAATLYLGGFVLLLGRLLAGMWITRRLLRRARPVEGDAGLRVCESSEVRVPLTAGYLFPRVILPLDWRAWDDATRRAVMAHEAAHVRRRDVLVNLLAAVNACLFWFHPLAWWLERRLAVLAEHAADDAAVACCEDARHYAATLLSLAASLIGRRHRLVVSGVGMEGGRIVERIRRVLACERPAARLSRLGATGIWCAAAVVVWFAGAVQLERVARAQQYDPHIPASMRLTAQQFAELEQQHAANPDDEKVTQKLLLHYQLTNQGEEHAQLILWLIDHHPESRLLRGAHFFTSSGHDAYYEEAKNRWLVQIADHPNDARILGNAAFTLGVEDLATAIECLQRAQAIDTPNWTADLARYYSWAFGTSEWERVRATLLGSNDIELILATVSEMVTRTGQLFLGSRKPAPDLGRVRSSATELLNRVEQLQPSNQGALELKEGIRGLGSVIHSDATNVTIADDRAAYRVDKEVAVANLLSTAAPLYPPEARARGLEATVSLQIRIDATGHVESAAPMGGDPIFANEAVAAVRQYVYQPILRDGKPSAVLTAVDVPFRLRE